MTTAQDWIEGLSLQSHPEGGWYAESYRSSESIPAASLPPRFPDARSFYTSIYFLLEEGQFSTLHRLQADEIWHFHAGAALEIVVIHPDGRLTRHFLGNSPVKKEFPQVLVPHGTWFGARSLGTYSLVGCTMAPGFDFADFEMAKRESLQAAYPAHSELIETFTP